jgi:hypothetical protein
MSEAPRQRKRAVKLFYCGTSFYAKNLHKEWMNITDGVAKHYLIRGGFRGGKSEHTLTEADAQLLTVRERDNVTYAGPIAGQRTGSLDFNGERILVTRAPLLPVAKKGACALTLGLIDAWFAEDAPLVKEWLRAGHLRVVNRGGPLLPALAVAGASGTGKSLLAEHIAKPLLGGRCASPLRYSIGETPHNEDLCGSELLCLDDPPAALRFEKLAMLRERIKEFVAKPTDSLHPKGKRALDVPVIRALLVCLNSEQKNLRVLDFADPTMMDKLMLLRVRARPAALPQSHDYEATVRFAKELRRELPHLLWHLLHEFKLPKERRWERGQPCHRDAELLNIAREDDAVTKVLWLIGELEMVPAQPLTCPEWDKRLRSELGELARRTLENGGHALSLGHVFRDAAARHPEVVIKGDERAHGGLHKWRVDLAKWTAPGGARD